MEEAVGKKTEQELNKEINGLIDELAQTKVRCEAAELEAREIKHYSTLLEERADKQKAQLQIIDTAMKDIFGIEYATARSRNDLIEQFRKAISSIRDGCAKIKLPPEEPIGAAAWLINAKRKRKTSPLKKFFHGSEEYEDYDVYSVSDLREIAEHLLAYCKNNESEVGADVRD